MAVPSVVSTAPADGATDATITTTIEFEFDVALDSDSVTIKTFFVYDAESLEELEGQVSVSSDGKTVTFTPNRSLFENRMYAAVASGVGSGASTYILSSGGDPLADDYRITFRTAEERYVTLEEAVERSDGDYVAPVRVVESTLPSDITETASVLELSSSSPASFSTDQNRCINEVRLTMDSTIEPSGALDALSLETYPVMGMEEYYAAPDGTGDVWLSDVVERCDVDFDALGVTEPDYTQPTGTFSIDGSDVVWSRGAGEPCFNYNTEVQITISTDLQSTSGAALESESAVIFTTQFYPLFVGSRMVRTELGPVGRAFMDDTINRVIHRWSLDAMEQAAYQFNVDRPYPAVKRYVLYNTIVNLIDDLITQVATNGEARKVLGDLEIQLGNPESLTRIPIYVRAQKKLKVLLRELRYYRGQSGPRGFIKGRRAFDARQDLRSRTWDNITYRHPWDLTPRANSAEERMQKLLGSLDHHDRSPYIPYTVYAQTPSGAGLFTCPGRE